MSDNINEKLNAETEVAAAEIPAAEDTKRLTPEYIMAQIEKLLDDKSHIATALGVLNDYCDDHGGAAAGSPPDVAGQARFTAIADTVKCRETTIQQALSFYKEMYNDIKPSQLDIALAQAERILNSPMSAQFDEAEVWNPITEAFKKSLLSKKEEESSLDFKRRAIMEHIQCQSMSPQEIKELLAILDN